MRYIDLDIVEECMEAEPAIEAAEKARKEILAAGTDAERAALIKANRAKWVAFRSVFESLYGEKCWYTESKNPGTDDDIDHYRPKGRLAGGVDHSGYWWEALNWRNFRLSSHRANRLKIDSESRSTLGKGAHFPLFDEAQRWRDPNEPSAERPILLDPTNPEDPPYLTFDPRGRVAVAPLYSGDADAEKRVEASRIYLHLDWVSFVNDRRAIYYTVVRKVADGDRLWPTLSSTDTVIRSAMRSVARELVRMAQDEQAYASAARTYILGFRDKEWIKKMVLPHIKQTPA